jgi:hypothetical protein
MAIVEAGSRARVCLGHVDAELVISLSSFSAFYGIAKSLSPIPRTPPGQNGVCDATAIDVDHDHELLECF